MPSAPMGRPAPLPGADLSLFGNVVEEPPLGADKPAPALKASEASAKAPNAPGGGKGHGDTPTPPPQTRTYEDGSTYSGQLVQGRRHGHGEWQTSAGHYVGEWVDDAMHGRGKHTWTDGRLYEGEFKAGKFWGRGRMVWHAQKGVLVYDGEYRDDVKHGTGRFLWADGRSYDGEWSMGKRHGRGHYTDSKGETKVGYWQGNQFERWEDDTGAITRTPTQQSELERGLPG